MNSIITKISTTLSNIFIPIFTLICNNLRPILTIGCLAVAGLLLSISYLFKVRRQDGQAIYWILTAILCLLFIVVANTI